MNILTRIIYWLMGWPIRQVSRANSIPRPEIKVVEPVIGKPGDRPYMTPGIIALLALIRLHEGGRSDPYNADFAQNNGWQIVGRTFDEVRTLGRSQVSLHHEASSAIGAYQLLSKTLDSLKSSLELGGQEIFDEAMQDDLAIALAARRGLWDYARGGSITASDFALNLSKEWASLPVPRATRGASRQLRAGSSYYAGDGLNRSFHKVEDVMSAVRAIRTPPLINFAKEIA